MTNEDISKLSAAICKQMEPYYTELIQREMAQRVHEMRMNILTDIGETEIRAMVKEAVRSHVSVEVISK